MEFKKTHDGFMRAIFTDNSDNPQECLIEKSIHPPMDGIAIGPIMGDKIIITQKIAEELATALVFYIHAGRLPGSSLDHEEDDKTTIRERFFAALRQANSTGLVIMADGSGDSGDIEDWVVLVAAGGNPFWVKNNNSPMRCSLPYEETTAILAQTLAPGITGEDAMRELADEVFQEPSAPDWVNNEGGRVYIHVDLTQDPPITKVDYEQRIETLEPAGTFLYNALTSEPLENNPPPAIGSPAYVTDWFEHQDLQAPWDKEEPAWEESDDDLEE